MSATLDALARAKAFADPHTLEIFAADIGDGEDSLNAGTKDWIAGAPDACRALKGAIRPLSSRTSRAVRLLLAGFVSCLAPDDPETEILVAAAANALHQSEGATALPIIAAARFQVPRRHLEPVGGSHQGKSSRKGPQIHTTNGAFEPPKAWPRPDFMVQTLVGPPDGPAGARKALGFDRSVAEDLTAAPPNSAIGPRPGSRGPIGMPDRASAPIFPYPGPRFPPRGGMEILVAAGVSTLADPQRHYNEINYLEEGRGVDRIGLLLTRRQRRTRKKPIYLAISTSYLKSSASARAHFRKTSPRQWVSSQTPPREIVAKVNQPPRKPPSNRRHPESRPWRH